MNLIEANDQISLCSDVFQAVTRLKATSMLRASTCFQRCRHCTKHGDSASVSVAKVM